MSADRTALGVGQGLFQAFSPGRCLVKKSSISGPGVSVFTVGDSDAIRRAQEIMDDAGTGYAAFDDFPGFFEDDGPGRVGCVLIELPSPFSADDPAWKRLASLSHELSVIAVCDSLDLTPVVRAVRHGAFDVLAQPLDPEELLNSVRAALDVSAPASPSQPRSAPAIDREKAAAAIATLTGRQIEILERISAGQPNKIVAADLGISQRTVENHRATIMKKMGAVSISQLIQIVLTLRQNTRPSA